jgi:hypothetical protein
MEPEGSLPFSQKPSTGLYFNPSVNNTLHYFYKISFNIILPPTSSSS